MQGEAGKEERKERGKRKGRTKAFSSISEVLPMQRISDVQLFAFSPFLKFTFCSLFPY